MYLTPLTFIILLASSGHSIKTVYNVGVLMASRLDSPFDLERCGPAVDIALEIINEKFLTHHGVELQKVQGSYPTCSGALAPGLAADMHFKDDVIAFIGPACAFALEPVARLAAYWNTPIITGMGDQPPSEGELAAPASVVSRMHRLRNLRVGSKPQTLFNDKGKYPTLTRMSYCQCRLPLVFTSVFERFGWAHVALLLDKSDLFSLTVGKSLEWGLRKEGVLKAVRELDGNERESCEALLRDVSMYARVVILSVRGSLVREFLLAAHALGMTRGDWAFLDVEIFQGGYWGETGWAANDSRDAAARAAYEALLRVSLKLPTGDRFDEFADTVRARAKLHYNYSFSDGEEVNFFIGAFYDGVYLLGMALNETLTEGGDIRDGRNITRRMWGRDFHGITGHVRIDAKGDRDADYAILDLDPITGKFEVVAFYHGLNSSYKPVAGKAIHWPGGRRGPPPDTPRCGFLGTDPRCQGDTQTVIIYCFIGLALFLTFAGVTACVVYKQARIDPELNHMAWRVRPEEVLVEVGTGLGTSPALHSINEVLKLSLGWSTRGSVAASNISGTTLNLSSFTVGLYKGNRVAVKKIHRKKLDLNKKLLWEIKQARNVSHENTARFIGACVDCPLVFILTEYCPKGSLKDVLANDELQLDWSFRTSLVHDIVQGMCYLHAGFGPHGKLRSSNCLIDGRFVLKISDYGLHTLCTPTDLIKDDNYYYKLLWTAPELISGSIYPGSVASLKGDVYSFGIILEEIVLRAGPFHHYKPALSNKELVSRVSAHETPPFRPVATATGGGGTALQLLELAASCWAESVDDRPSFDAINANYIKGYCDNLMDDLLRRMEQYANNLESLVEEKTEQLSLEKRRSEELLYQVLPRPVAQQLMAGEVVQPESFECVTVYFSDIVGFTELCAASTPMQVVDLLNDLYSTFDRIIGFYDVYKVETIGDAYMVVSGLPERNGDQHAREICLMALAVVEAVRTFVVRHRPTHRLEVRVGVHSGPVCAGVVGVKMPHYCLFGDTVNTASRMESTGQRLQLPNSCDPGQYYDTASLSCQTCAVNSSLVPSEDGYSCKCNEHSVPTGLQQCRTCNATELVSSDSLACVPRKCQNTSGRFVCRKCSSDFISVTKNLDGSPMKEVICVKCARGYKSQGNACIRCESCTCNKNQILVRDKCLPKTFVNTRPKYEEKLLHPQELLDVVKFEYLCTQNDIHSCHTLSNKCVKNFYSTDIGGPCRLWLQSKTTNPKGLPTLIVSSTSADRKPGQIQLSRNEKSTLLIVAAVFTSNGGMKMLDNFDENIGRCSFPMEVTMGTDKIAECQVTVTKLMNSDMNETLSPYLYIDGEYKQLPVTIRKPNGYNIQRGVWSSNKFTRFFLVHDTLSTMYNITNTIYLRTLLLRIRLEREKHTNGSLSVDIVMETEYAMKSPRDDIVTVTWNIEHEMPSAGIVRGIEVWGGILGTFLTIYALAQWRGVLRRGGLHYTLVPILAGSVADILYFAVLFSTLHALAAEAGTLGMTLPLSRQEEKLIKIFIYSAFSLKALKLVWINWKQCTYDIFFLDWSEYNPQVKEMPFSNENIGWKATLLAKEWSGLQTLRRAHPGFTATVALIVIHLLTPLKWKVPQNTGYLWALFSSAWWGAYCLVLLTTWLRERFRYSPVIGFPKICTTVGLSLLVFQEENYAHYVHGRNDDSKEVRSMAGPLSTCRVACVPQLRSVYEQLSAPGPGMLEETESRQALLSKFLAAFFERALDGLNWVASERTLFEKLLDVEVTSREGGSTSALLYDDDTTPSCFAVTWWGEEWNLSTFDAMLFSAVFIATNDALLAGLLTIFIWQIMKQLRQWFGNRNQTRKTSVEINFQ